MNSLRLRIAIATDAWHPQVNGVARTLEYTKRCLEERGHRVRMIAPSAFLTYPCPTYSSIRLALFPRRGARRALLDFRPNAVHIATEGPIGHAVRRVCITEGVPFTTSFHTRFPEYIRARIPLPVTWSYRYLRRYHGSAAVTMVPTPSIRERLATRGFRNLEIWARGVDTNLFRPGPKSFLQAPRPVMMYVGRVAVEKNLDAFLQLDLSGSKFVVGDGPDLKNLKDRYPNANFVGEKQGGELASTIAAADVMVFPSLTDTFGLVLLEAMACGVPVAAFPVTGPIDVVQNGRTGCLDRDLSRAVTNALKLNSSDCVDYARSNSWGHWTERFLSLLRPFEAGPLGGTPAW